MAAAAWFTAVPREPVAAVDTACSAACRNVCSKACKRIPDEAVRGGAVISEGEELCAVIASTSAGDATVPVATNPLSGATAPDETWFDAWLPLPFAPSASTPEGLTGSLDQKSSSGRTNSTPT